MAQLASMAEGSLHPDILTDNIRIALGNPGCYKFGCWSAEAVC